MYVVHVISLDAEFRHLFHNVPLRYLEASCREFLFARFAWSIFMFVKPFLFQGTQRRVIQYRYSGLNPEWAPETLDTATLRQMYGGGGSRSASPKKRSRQSRDEIVGEADADDPKARQIRENDRWYEMLLASEEEEERGRPRSRRKRARVDTEATAGATPTRNYSLSGFGGDCDPPIDFESEKSYVTLPSLTDGASLLSEEHRV